MSYDSRQDTLDHIAKVEGYLTLFAALLRLRGLCHDESKLESPEKEIFDMATPLLSASRYGSPEYMASLVKMRPALDHHYEANSHHPEHFTNGIDGMSLLDVFEMLCDWRAASQRHAGGNIQDSLRINAKRFSIDAQLVSILENTVKEMGWITESKEGST